MNAISFCGDSNFSIPIYKKKNINLKQKHAFIVKMLKNHKCKFL